MLVRSTSPMDLRHHLPNTRFFRGLAPTMSLRDLAGYAQGSRRGLEIGHNLRRIPAVRLRGPYDYSPYGADAVERAHETHQTDNATGRWNRALVSTNGGAVLGIGAMKDEKNPANY